MKIFIGFQGGSSIFELGSASDMELFFDCIKYDVVPAYPDIDFSLLLDRFYKRYLRLDELDAAIYQMQLAEDTFKKQPKSVIDWGNIESGEINSNLDLTKDTLYQIYKKYFDAFYHCVEAAKVNYEFFSADKDYKYQPVLIVITTMPYSLDYDQIPLSYFDAMGKDEMPVWWTGRIPKK